MKKSTAVLAAFTAAAVLTACAGEPENGGTGNGNEGNPSADGNGGEATDEEVDPDNLVIATLSDIEAIDPHTSNDVPSSTVQHNLFESLLMQTEDMEIEPLLATEWENTDDTTWEFQLREDVTFHDGSEFNADVVKANLDRILDEDLGSPRAALFEMIEEVVVIDDHTVEIHTEFPFSPLPAHLAHSGGGMMSQEIIEEDYARMEDGGQPGDYINENPAGTAIFEFDEWNPGSEIILTRNDDYWGDPAGVEQVTFQVTPEDLTRIGELETGAADIIFPVSPSDTERIEDTEGMDLYTQESLGLAYIGFNMEKEPFDDPQVRRAMAMAINKEELLEGVLEGTGTPATGPLGEQIFGFSDEVDEIEYDPQGAQELLAEAGYEDGFETTLWTNDSRERIDIAELVQAQLSVVGVDLSIEVLEWGAYLENTSEGEHDMFILGWSTATGDADYLMYNLFHSSQQGDGNKSFINNPEIDDLLEQGRSETDQGAREDIYEEAMELLVDEAKMLYLYHQDYLVGVRDEVQGFWKHPNGIYQLHDVTIEEE
ncbi:glutathione ABC transporter substrate-binding protein [Alkalicoccus saliphilus]|uniref:Glutathione ABC transporter substrate-binding protein n=1 Tax=Alkalicoccus saliphilus TaxID=200989 RepID=A0A2T4U3F8_9BACI|nr:glutathione ABC transporter substrate-binding protein [Alkalicoccus saliphilus]PTL37938.1 glutathione ABC transporter substrate-binding protein [Alkalicoccus saliphilus]